MCYCIYRLIKQFNSINLLHFYPSAKSRRVLLWACPSVPPSVCRHFTFFRVQGAFLHQISPFLVCRLVIKLFCGSFNDFGEIPFLGLKRRAVYRKYAIFWDFTIFQVQGAFLYQISPFLVFGLVIKLFCGSFNDFGEIPFLGPKTARCVPKICHFLKFQIFLSEGCVSSPNIAIFGL